MGAEMVDIDKNKIEIVPTSSAIEIGPLKLSSPDFRIDYLAGLALEILKDSNVKLILGLKLSKEEYLT